MGAIEKMGQPVAAEINTFSFHAGSADEVQAVIEAANLAGVVGIIVTREVHDGCLPDVEVEIKAPATLEQMRHVMRAIEDGQIMLQTLRQCPLAANSMARDYDLD